MSRSHARRRRAAAGAALAAVLLILPALADDSGVRVDPTTKWVTQEWPMIGQDNDQQKNITASFTTARLGNLATSPAAGMRFFTNYVMVGGSCGVPLPTGPIPGEVATAAVGGSIHQMGAHGIGAVCVEEVIEVFVNVAGGMNQFIDAFGRQFPNLVTGPCGPTEGTPLIVPITSPGEVSETTSGQVDIFAYFHDCPSIRRFRLTVGASFSASAKAVLPNIGSVSVLSHDIPASEFDGSASFVGGPVLDNSVIYVVTNRKHYQQMQGPGFLYALKRSDLSEKWKSQLQTGAANPGPVPKGQPPPEPGARYHATTTAVVRQDLIVVGCVQYDDNDNAEIGYALLGYNTLDGTQRFAFKTDAKILPNPVILRDLIVFGTANGRAYAIRHDAVNKANDGLQQWATSTAARLQYRTKPFNVDQEMADDGLYGPAVDSGANYAYFAGRGGRVHRFDVQGGTFASSKTLFYFGGLTLLNGNYSLETDVNGEQLIRPCMVNAPPALLDNRTLFVKCWTQNYGVLANSGYLFAVRVPELTFHDGIDPIPAAGGGDRFDPSARAFVYSGSGQLYGGVSLNWFYFRDNNCNPIDPFNPNASFPFLQYNAIKQVQYVYNCGAAYQLSSRGTPGGTFDDTGGVSIGSGFIFGTSSGGGLVAIPSTNSFTPPAGSAAIGPFAPPPPGPAAGLGLVPLGPIQVYPNPFRPATAVGGVAKFRNLPDGSVVELYTLAHERVRILQTTLNLATWNGRNEAGQDVASGPYLYRIVLPGDVPPVTGTLLLRR